MARFALIALFGSLLASIASAAPLPSRVELADRASTTFVEQAYSAFQISDGVGGTAADQANAIFVTPFADVDLTTISEDTIEAINTMREAAEDAETEQFDPQIDAASATTAAALQVGKIKNKVLKLTAEIEDINIKIAQAQASGSDTSSLQADLASETTKLNSNLALDKANAGKISQGVA